MVTIVSICFVILVLVTAALFGENRRLSQHLTTFMIRGIREGERYVWERRKRLFPISVLFLLLSFIVAAVTCIVFIEYEIIGNFLVLLLSTLVAAIVAYCLGTKIATRRLEKWAEGKNIRVYPEC